jgi:cation diffusion facilitator family transporter
MQEKCCFYQKFQNQENQNYIFQDAAKRKLLIVCANCITFMLIEFIGGLWSKSLAIMTDAAHLLSDLTGFVISILALNIAKYPPDKKYTFGYHRAEVVGALASVALIWVLTILLLAESISRIMDTHHTINGTIMLYSATIGLFINIIMAYILHSEVLL